MRLNKHPKDNFRKSCERILGNCELYAIDERYRDAVAHAITLLLLDAESSNRIRIGDNLIPPKIVKKNISKLNFFIIEHAVNKFKEASERFEIKNTIVYLKACIFNSINEYQIDIDSQLRMTGVI